MKKIISTLKNDLPLLLLCGFFIFALFNPVFKKYDYGAGFPLIALFTLVLLIILILDFRKKDNELKRSVFDKLFLNPNPIFEETTLLEFGDLVGTFDVSIFEEDFFALTDLFLFSLSLSLLSISWSIDSVIVGTPLAAITNEFSINILSIFPFYTYHFFFLQPIVFFGTLLLKI